MLIMAGVGRARGGAAGAVRAALRATVGGVDALEPLSTRYGKHGWLGQPVVFTRGRGQPHLPVLTNTDKTNQLPWCPRCLRHCALDWSQPLTR